MPCYSQSHTFWVVSAKYTVTMYHVKLANKVVLLTWKLVIQIGWSGKIYSKLFIARRRSARCWTLRERSALGYVTVTIILKKDSPLTSSPTHSRTMKLMKSDATNKIHFQSEKCDVYEFKMSNCRPNCFRPGSADPRRIWQTSWPKSDASNQHCNHTRRTCGGRCSCLVPTDIANRIWIMNRPTTCWTHDTMILL